MKGLEFVDAAEGAFCADLADEANFFLGVKKSFVIRFHVGFAFRLVATFLATTLAVFVRDPPFAFAGIFVR